MKILVVHNYYREAGGERVSLSAQVSLLQSRGHDVIQFTRNSSEIDEYNIFRKVKFFQETVFSSQTYRDITAIIKENKPQIAHIHNVFPLISPSVYLALHNHNIPIVQTIYNFRFLCPNGLFYTNGQICEKCILGNTFHAIRFRCFRNSRSLSALYGLTIALHRKVGTFDLIKAFVVPAEFTGQKLIEGGIATKENMHTIKYILPKNVPQMRVGNLSKEKVDFVFIGRLSREKGIWTLLHAFRKIKGVTLKILGDGPLIVSIQSWLQQNHISNIELVGFVSGQKKWELLSSAVATIVPSIWYENSPFTVLESMAVGTPVIGSAIGSLPEIIQHQKTGLLFKPGDSEDLFQKLEWIKNNPEKGLQMGRNAQIEFKLQYDSEIYYHQLMAIYKSFL